MATKEDYYKNTAANNEWTIEDIKSTEEQLIGVIQSNLHGHFKRCHLQRGPNYWLLDGSGDLWLAFTLYDLQKEMRDADIEYDDQLLRTVAYGHLEQFQSNGITIAVPGSTARYLEDPFYLPIQLNYPEGWKDGEYHSLQRFEELVSRYEMSPAEALDYWAVEHHNEDAISWGGKRSVDPEAVRKNVRQAKEKLQSDGLGASHKNSDIRVVPLEDVPDDAPHDPDKDMFYVPSDQQIED